jgi:molybdopterin/thiamine biosynthesis adenylyltransferase
MTISIIETFKHINFIQIGCGGTGSWLVPLLSKFINNLALKFSDLNLKYILFDGDTVEDRNILRQNFDNWDIEKNKAEALALKNVFNYEKIIVNPINCDKKSLINNIISCVAHEREYNKHLFILIGCVDKNKYRRMIFSTIKTVRKDLNSYFTTDGFIYIDAGNLLYNGQVITLPFGLKEYQKKPPKLKFFKMFPAKDDTENAPSCAFFADQSQSINNLAASIIFCNIQKILINSELPPEMITFNSSGYSTFEI